MSKQEIEELLAKAVQGDLMPDEANRLLEMCQRDEVLRRRMVRMVQVDRLVGLALEEDGKEFSSEFRYRIEGEDGGEFSATVVSGVKREKLLKFASGVAVAAALIILSLFLVLNSGREEVGEIVRLEATDWSSHETGLEVGDMVEIGQGLVELSFDTGVRVVIEAPAAFEVMGENRGFLHYGKLVAEVNDKTAHGFVIDGPSGRLVDLGTKFAVAVGDGGEMEVHVIEGMVDATVTGGEPSRLRRNEAMRLANGKALRMVADASKFVTRMPVYQDSPPRSVRWSFDEREGAAILDSGTDLGGGMAEGALKSFSGKGVGPRRVGGKFGRALEFDGVDAFVETQFSGVMGRGPRTVAFWVRAPEDFNPMQGYGIVNWGDIRVPGGAWQISVNGTEKDGPLGRLRIGTHWGQVIGITDLRDGQWHHCAVVMYGDEDGDPNTATHVLLYVDGQLEPAARKSVQAVDTVEPSSENRGTHGIWLGRNLGFENEESPSVPIYGKFFRGSIDEMVICDTALSRDQILRLLNVNEMPQE